MKKIKKIIFDSFELDDLIDEDFENCMYWDSPDKIKELREKFKNGKKNKNR